MTHTHTTHIHTYNALVDNDNNNDDGQNYRQSPHTTSIPRSPVRYPIPLVQGSTQAHTQTHTLTHRLNIYPGKHRFKTLGNPSSTPTAIISIIE
jgi:hypothetical protein